MGVLQLNFGCRCRGRLCVTNKNEMANQRHPDRRRFQTWIMERDSEVLKQVAEKEGLSYSELLEVMTIILEEKLEKQSKQFKEIKDTVKYKQRGNQ